MLVAIQPTTALITAEAWSGARIAHSENRMMLTPEPAKTTQFTVGRERCAPAGASVVDVLSCTAVVMGRILLWRVVQGVVRPVAGPGRTGRGRTSSSCRRPLQCFASHRP